MRILQAPSNIANQAWATAQGLRARGHHVDVWHYGPNPFDFPADRIVDHQRDPQAFIDAFGEALRADYDVFHFHFARSLVFPIGGLPWFWDLPVLRALGKRVLFTFHGTDVRLRSRHIEEDPWSYYRFADVTCDEERIGRSLDVIRTFAQRMIVASVLNRTFVPDAVYVPKALDLPAYRMIGPVREREPLVVHVPSRRATKGTDFVLRGVEALREKVSFRFELAESVTNERLRALYAEADIVVDNLLLGDCEVSALEAMAMGKPVITRIRDEVRERHPDLPVVDADPDTFVEALRALVADPRRRGVLGERGRAYVETTHASPVVAGALEGLMDEPARPVYETFPGWISPPREDKVASLEERVRGLGARVADLEQRLEVQTRQADSLRERLDRLRRHPVIRFGTWLKTATRGRRVRSGS